MRLQLQQVPATAAALFLLPVLLVLPSCASVSPRPDATPRVTAAAPALETADLPEIVTAERPLPSRPLADELAGAPSAPRAQAPRRSVGIPSEPGIFNLTLGARFLEDARWAQLDDQLALGLDYTIKQRDSWIGLNFGLNGSGTRERVSGVDVDAWILEASIGPRAYLSLPGTPFYAYAGVGLSLAYGEMGRAGLRRVSETTFGGSAAAALMIELNRSQALGVEWRTLQGTDFGEEDNNGPADMNYQQISLVFSAAF